MTLYSLTLFLTLCYTASVATSIVSSTPTSHSVRCTDMLLSRLFSAVVRYYVTMFILVSLQLINLLLVWVDWV